MNSKFCLRQIFEIFIIYKSSLGCHTKFGSAVLMFIVCKQTDRQAKYIYIYIDEKNTFLKFFKKLYSHQRSSCLNSWFPAPTNFLTCGKENSLKEEMLCGRS